ncbi:right-handed parallel beta-helix repeat-containing protein [Sorangium sp. So ce1099]|uniref:right-handed parallel beta-helix repeat-containing protein n=1 Tax=Sorangium sp. So ce1099 TaxID=3133331 RepID=UPI003F5F7A5A
MAIPGEARCREVAPCGEGPWGDIPVEANTQFVDQAYAGADSDGTAARPWTTIQRAIHEAGDGAIVAVAAGSYVEDVSIAGKAVRLWGRCPGLVEVQGAGARLGANEALRVASSGAEVRGIGVTGAGIGVRVSGARDVTIEQIWVHGVNDMGILVDDVYGSTSVMLRGSLVEENRDVGVYVYGAHATVESTVIRSTKPSADGAAGWGIGAKDDAATGERATVGMRACVIEQNHDAGVHVYGSDATVEDTVIRSTRPGADETGGWGIGIGDDAATGERAAVSVRACVIEQNHEAGVYVYGSDAAIEATVVRDTQPSADGTRGWGIAVKDSAAAGERAIVSVRGCAIEQNHEVGVLVHGSDAAVEATVVRDTQPSAAGARGWGIGVQDSAAASERATVSVRDCVIEQNHEVGVYVYGSDAAIDASVVRNTRPGADGAGGWGLIVQANASAGKRGSANVRACLVEHNHDSGVDIIGSDATIEASVVRDTQPGEDRTRGWGVHVRHGLDAGERAIVTVRECIIEQNHEAGVYVYGSDATIEASVVRGTQAMEDGTLGRGISVRDVRDTGERARVIVRDCLVEQNHEAGVLVRGSDAVLETSLIRATRPGADGEHGGGIVTLNDPDTGERAGVIVRACLVEQNHDGGVLVFGSDAIIEGTVVRTTQPGADGEHGGGVIARDDPDTGERAGVTVRACLVEQNHELGVLVHGSDAMIEGTVVRATQPLADGEHGGGIIVMDDLDARERADVTVCACLVEQNHEVGIAVVRSTATIGATVVRTTMARTNNAFGDGVTVVSGTTTIQSTAISDNARAGVANFGSKVTVLDTLLTCNAFELNGEEYGGDRASFDGSSGWQCTPEDVESCTETDGKCSVISAGLEPPPALEPLPPPPQR